MNCLFFISFYATFLGTLLLFASSTANLKDQDDPGYTFGRYTFKGQEVVRTCAWLSQNPEKTKLRKDNWCDKQWLHNTIRNKCPSSCNQGVGTPNDYDDPNYTFGSYLWEGTEVVRTCSWITQNPEKVTVRKGTWCNKMWLDNITIRDKCPSTCGKKADDPNFTFGSYEWNGQDVNRTCAWITASARNTKKRKEKWCGRKWNNKLICEKCSATCKKKVSKDQCDDDSGYTFGRYTYLGQEVTRTCAWITDLPAQTETRKKRWCNAQWLHNTIKDKCPDSCAKEECSSKKRDKCSDLSPKKQSPQNPFEWYDAAGKEFTCDFYSYEENCNIFGNDFANFGWTAKQACCNCGGGERTARKLRGF